ncbi:MAG: DNA topoisomerase I [Actinobacteria bacterium]|nr:MAG: DNA topoisomerase I [Actinomycetota bacterium]
MIVVVSEKNIAARRIAEILSGGRASDGKVGSVPVYKFSRNGTEYTSIGLRGHIMKVDFPEEYHNWQKVNPADLVHAPVVKVASEKAIVSALQKVAKGADEIIVATDFDREGELIGLDAVHKIEEVNPKAVVRRARFSALTKGEVEHAFSNLEDVYENLASAGEARQDIDLVWGAALTRFISLASGRLGHQFLSVGRVQSPTLALIIERERERQAFKIEPYWTIKARFSRNGDTFLASHKTDRFFKKDEAEAVLGRIGDTGTVTKVARQRRDILPPAPFNTTSFLAAAASLGVSPARAMRIAEDLYTHGHISYPRVDNTYYPPSLNLRELLGSLEGSSEFGEQAARLASQEKLVATHGSKKATDHPPIHPTGLPDKASLGSQEWKIYELVVRRFFATVAPKAVKESTRIQIDANEEPFIVRGDVTIEDGFLEYYPYARRKDEELPRVEEGETLRIVEKLFEEKETQPPARYSQSALIQVMEKLGLGTKATRHSIIQHLYDRNYIHSDPIVPTELGTAVVEALRKTAERIASPQMTADLEEDMNAIAQGRLERTKVVDYSRELLDGVMFELVQKKGEVAEQISRGIREDRVVGRCPKCGKELRIIRSKKTRKRFVGCEAYPECRTSYPLPQSGEIVALNEMCEPCGTPRIKVTGKRGRPWILCLDPNCPTKEEAKKAKAAGEG